jgi:uncharacterized protein
MHFEIYQQVEGLMGTQWRWRLVAANNRKIGSGEGYYNKGDCLQAIGLLMETSRITKVYEK